MYSVSLNTILPFESVEKDTTKSVYSYCIDVKFTGKNEIAIYRFFSCNDSNIDLEILLESLFFCNVIEVC